MTLLFGYQRKNKALGENILNSIKPESKGPYPIARYGPLIFDPRMEDDLTKSYKLMNLLHVLAVPLLIEMKMLSPGHVDDWLGHFFHSPIVQPVGLSVIDRMHNFVFMTRNDQIGIEALNHSFQRHGPAMYQ